jgi:hypothetical protein
MTFSEAAMSRRFETRVSSVGLLVNAAVAPENEKRSGVLHAGL